MTTKNLGIIGITESQDGQTNDVENYHRKVSTGFSPLEKPWNTKDYPKAAGYFRIMELKYINVSGANGPIVVQKWILDKAFQKKLELMNSEKTEIKNKEKIRIPNQNPKKLPIMCLYADINQFADAKMTKWNASNNLECTSYGNGTQYTRIVYDDEGGMSHVNTGQFDKDGNEIKVCDIKNCKHRIKIGNKPIQCKPSIRLKIFPKLPGIEPNILEPWKFDSSSINTVIRITSSLRKIHNLMQLSYKAEKGAELTEEESKGKEWFFGKNLCLTHIQIVSGNKKVWVTDVIPSNTLKAELMGPIIKATYLAEMASKKRLIEMKKDISDGNITKLDYQNKNTSDLLKDAGNILKTDSENDKKDIIDADITEIETIEEKDQNDDNDNSSTNNKFKKKSVKDKLKSEQ